MIELIKSVLACFKDKYVIMTFIIVLGIVGSLLVMTPVWTGKSITENLGVNSKDVKDFIDNVNSVSADLSRLSASLEEVTAELKNMNQNVEQNSANIDKLLKKIEQYEKGEVGG